MTYPSEAQKTLSGETKLKSMNNCYVSLIKKDAEWQSLESVCITQEHKKTNVAFSTNAHSSAKHATTHPSHF